MCDLVAQKPGPTDFLHALAAKREHDHCNGLPRPEIAPKGHYTFASTFSFRDGGASLRRCLGSSLMASVVSRMRSNPTCQISPG